MSELVTRSPIELFWTAKKEITRKIQRRSATKSLEYGRNGRRCGLMIQIDTIFPDKKGKRKKEEETYFNVCFMWVVLRGCPGMTKERELMATSSQAS